VRLQAAVIDAALKRMDDALNVKDPPEGYVGKHRRPERVVTIFPIPTEVESTAWLPSVGKLPIPGWWVKPLIRLVVFLLVLVVMAAVFMGVRVQPDLPGAPTVQHGPTLPNGGP
jgi:hypothetical protein